MTATPRFRPCSMCGNAIRVQRVTCTTPGSVPVDLTICPLCDTRKCGYKKRDGSECNNRVLQATAAKCSDGHWLP